MIPVTWITNAIDASAVTQIQRRCLTVYEYNGLVTHVVDGDTLDIDVNLGFKLTASIRVRLRGIDPP